MTTKCLILSDTVNVQGIYIYSAGLSLYSGSWTIFVIGLEICNESLIPKI